MRILKKKTNILTNQERVEVANLIVDQNLPTATVARQFDISWHTADKAAKRKIEIEDQLESGTIKPDKKRNRTCKFPEIEQELFKWIKLMRVMKFPLSKQLIIAKAHQIAENLDLNIQNLDENDEKKQQIKSSSQKLPAKFPGSNGWF